MKLRKVSLKTILAAILMLIITSVSGATIVGRIIQSQRIDAASSVYSAYANQIIIFDLDSFIDTLPTNQERYDYLKVAFAVQGLINRNQPLLFYQYQKGLANNGGSNNTIATADSFWLSELTSPQNELAGYTQTAYTSFYDILYLAEELGVVNGVVLWDDDVPATSNVASTIAGVENLIPIRYDEYQYSCYTDLVINLARGKANRRGRTQLNASTLAVKRDLVGKFTGSGYLPNANLNGPSSATSSGSKKNDAYLWAKANYLDTKKTNSSLMAYSRDAWEPDCTDAACFVASNLPEKYLKPGESREVSVTILNNAPSEEWTKEGKYRVATKDNNGFVISNGEFGGYSNGVSDARLYFSSDNPISVGERITITFTITAPTAPGDYYLHLGVVHDGYDWFSGELKYKITVDSSSSTANTKSYYYPTYKGIAGGGQSSNRALFNTALNSSDYLIANRAFFFDLSPDDTVAPIDDRGQSPGRDVATLRALLGQQAANNGNKTFSVVGFVPWFVKYTRTADPTGSTLGDVDSEWKMVRIISTYGGETDADAMGPVGLTNASFYSKLSLNSLTQNNDKEAIKSGKVVKEIYDPNTIYVSIYMADYDGSSWSNAVLPKAFETSVADKYPLMWPIGADLASRVPQVYNWLYRNQKRNDYFVTGDNGTGYLNPNVLDSTKLDFWKSHNQTKNAIFDLDITGFLISTNLSGGTENKVSLGSEARNAYAAMTPTMVGHYSTDNSYTVNGAPFIVAENVDTSLKDSNGNPLSAGKQLYQSIINISNNHNSKFLVVREGAQKTRSAVYSAIDEAMSLAGGKIKIVDPYTLAYLYSNRPSAYKGCYSNGSAYQWVNGKTIPSGYSYVSTISAENDCRTTTKLTKPSLASASFVETGNTITPSITGFDSTTMTKTGDLSKQAAGSYTITISLKDKTNYRWADGTQDDVKLSWKITAPTKLTKPSLASASFVETGNTITPSITGFDSTTMTKTGDLSKQAAGSYTITISLKDKTNYRWADGTQDDVKLSWKIVAPSPPYTIKNYKVNETKHYIGKIPVNTAVDAFTANITLSNGYGVDVETKTINNKQVLYTGGKTKITRGSQLYAEYTNSVTGDINGDGRINSADLLRVRQHLLNTRALSGPYFQAADITNDGGINSADLLRVRQHLLGTRIIK